MPAVQISTGGRSNNMFVRGIGSGPNQSFDQSVGTFIDGVYFGRSRTNAASFLDLNSVEVLKGPQSTFFGNNAIAGALNIVTRKPDFTSDGSARALYGMFGQYAVEGAQNLPINDALAVRIAGTLNGENGWVKNIVTDSNVPRSRAKAGRISLMFKPDDAFDAVLKVDGSTNRVSGFYLGIKNCPPPSPYIAGAFCTAALAQRVPIYPSKETAQQGGQGTDLGTYDTALTMNYKLPAGTLTSVTGFYAYHSHAKLNVSGLPQTTLNIGVAERFHQFSQELRWTSPAGRRFEYMIGLYYQTDKLHVDQGFNMTLLSPVIANTPIFSALAPYVPLGQVVNFDQPESIYSAFGSASWNVTGKLKLSVGLRESVVEKKFDQLIYYGQATEAYGGIVTPLPQALQPLAGAGGNGRPGQSAGSRSDHGLLPSARAQYQFTRDTMAYFSYAKGFKSGGFNGFDTTGVQGNIPFSPERVDAYEVGLKSKWFDNRFLLNLALFRSNYSNLQVPINTGTGVSVVRNAASSVSKGVELESNWVQSSHFRFGANLTYLDAYFGDYRNAGTTILQAVAGVAFQDLSGRPTQFAPRWSGAFSASYTTDFARGWRVTGEIRPRFSAKYFTSGTDDPLMRQSSYTWLDMGLTFDSPDKRWSFDVIAKNLTSARVFDILDGSRAAPGTLLVVPRSPFNVAGQIRFHW